MTRQGCCVGFTQDADNILDRLEGLSKVIAPEIMEQALLETGRGKQKACRLSHRVMLWVVLAMGVLTHLPIRQVFKHARSMRPGDKTPSRSNLCEARQRLGVGPVRRVFDLVVRPLATPQTLGAFYKGLRLMGIDGTVMDVPDTPANAERFGRSSGGRGDGAFPQVRKVSLVELGTHVEVAMAIGGWHDSEQKLVGQLFDQIPADALLIEDRGFFSYEHWKTLDSRGVKLLLRIKGNMILRPIQRLPDGSYLAKIYPSSYARDKDRDGIVVRVIEYTLDDPQRTDHGQKHRLLTNKKGKPTSEQDNIRQALRFAKNLYGDTPAIKFGPLALKAVRETMVTAGRCRNTINKDVSRIRGMFRWAVENEMLPVTVHQSLMTLPGLAKDRHPEVRETVPVTPLGKVNP